MCKPALTLIPGGIIPSSGVAVCWEIDEQAGLWLGGTLQWRSWLWDSSSKDKYSCYSISAIILMFNELWWTCWMLVYEYVFFRWMIEELCILYDVLCTLLCMLFKLLISAFFLFMFMGLFARLSDWCWSCPLHRFKGWGRDRNWLGNRQPNCIINFKKMISSFEDF